ncbi:MAG: hypothetical protein J7K65_04855 [Planctomycetes bacterium]|nr:hypothetical protein [Planctomycetota bacterium]
MLHQICPHIVIGPAFDNRFIYLVTTQSFYGREDANLNTKLMKELPGVFNWALDGLVRLTKKGRFLESEAGLDAKARAEELGSPVISFVREWCNLKTRKQTRCQDLYDAYVVQSLNSLINSRPAIE